jgi:hypothetical protein
MNHACPWRCTVPVLFVRRNPHNVTRLDLAHFAAPALYPARAGDDEQRLAKRMRVPGGASPGSKRTKPERTRAGAGASMIGSCHTVPVKLSAGARRVGREPQL